MGAPIKCKDYSKISVIILKEFLGEISIRIVGHHIVSSLKITPTVELLFLGIALTLLKANQN